MRTGIAVTDLAPSRRRRPVARMAMVAVSAALAASGLVPAAAAAAGDTVLSTGTTGSANGAFGIGQAIRDGEARRGTVLSTRSQVEPGGGHGGVSSGGTVPARPAAGLSAQPAFANLPVYVGTLGNRPIRLRIGPKPEERDSLHGEYVIEGAPGVRLLAGEYVDGALLMEESADGTHVSGQWEGVIDQQGGVRGQWFDVANPNQAVPFAIRPLSVLVIPPAAVAPTGDGSGVVYAPPPPRSSILDGKAR